MLSRQYFFCTFLVTLAASSIPARAEEKSPQRLNSTLKVQFLDGATVSSKVGRFPLTLTFLNPTENEQTFTNAEYQFVLLDHEGVDTKIGVIATTELRTITLKNRTDSDRPNVSVPAGKLKVGEEYYLVATLRNLTGLVKFIAKE